jgi:hypothetical protein
MVTVSSGIVVDGAPRAVFAYLSDPGDRIARLVIAP